MTCAVGSVFALCPGLDSSAWAAEPFTEVATASWIPFPFNEPWGISPDGDYVVYRSSSHLHKDWGYMWSTDGGVVSIGSLGGDDGWSIPYGVSRNGSVVVGESSPPPNGGTTRVPFRWSPTDGIQELHGFDAQTDILGNYAWGVSDDGTVIAGGCLRSGILTSVMWSNSTTPVAILDPIYTNSECGALGVSPGGEFITGNVDTGGVLAAYLWSSADGLTILPSTGTPARNTFAMDVSEDGTVVVGMMNDYVQWTEYAQAYRWVDGAAPTLLPSIPGETNFSTAWAVSSDGKIVVGEVGAAIPPPYDGAGLDEYASTRAAYWDADNTLHVIQEELSSVHGADLEGWLLTSARGVSSNGLRIVGLGIWTPDSNGFYEVGWVFDRAAVPPRITAMTLSGTNLLLEVTGLIPTETNHVDQCEIPLPEGWESQLTFIPTSSTETISVGVDATVDVGWLRVRPVRPD